MLQVHWVVPGRSSAVAFRGHRVVIQWNGRTVGIAAACAFLIMLWIFQAIVGPSGTDTSAQAARVSWWRSSPISTYDLSWYGGIHPQSYSVVATAFLAIAGLQLGGGLTVLVSAGLFGALLDRGKVARPRIGAACAALTLVGNQASGRLTFAVGMATGLAATYALLAPDGNFATHISKKRFAVAATLTVLTTLASPVAGVFLLIAAGVLLLRGRVRDAIGVALLTLIPMLAIQLAFPDSGSQQYTQMPIPPALIVCVVVFLMLPRRDVSLRLTTVLYAAGVLATFLVTNPVGLSVDRLALMFAAPIVLATASSRLLVLTPVVIGLLIYQGAIPTNDIVRANDRGNHAAYFADLNTALVSLGSKRVEVVPMANHWEATYVANAVPLARGWLRQADTKRNAIFFGPTLDAPTYLAWLRDNGVDYVAMSDAPVDNLAARTEADLLASGSVPGLTLAWDNEHWQVWRVEGSPGLVDYPGTVVNSSGQALTVSLPRTADVLVRVRWSAASLSVTGPSGGCLYAGPEPDSWTILHAPTAGTYRIETGAIGSSECDASLKKIYLPQLPVMSPIPVVPVR